MPPTLAEPCHVEETRDANAGGGGKTHKATQDVYLLIGNPTDQPITVMVDARNTLHNPRPAEPASCPRTVPWDPTGVIAACPPCPPAPFSRHRVDAGVRYGG